MGEGAKIIYKHIDDLSSHYMNARTAAEQARVEWLKYHVAWLKKGTDFLPHNLRLRLGPMPSALLIAAGVGRFPRMAEEGRPTGINYEDAMGGAQRGGNVDFEERKARVVCLHGMDEMGELHSARLELDLEDERLVLFGHYSGNEFMEVDRERPF
jgi:hypothetical protein